mmetsp:Transcript_31223/g.56576  ORF Transcript_31223/g.56576 Transcript_31223/m.56576 type:complete len:150 (-) Transcript_31223:792-1241(-)
MPARPFHEDAISRSVKIDVMIVADMPHVNMSASHKMVLFVLTASGHVSCFHSKTRCNSGGMTKPTSATQKQPTKLSTCTKPGTLTAIILHTTQIPRRITVRNTGSGTWMEILPSKSSPHGTTSNGAVTITTTTIASRTTVGSHPVFGNS